VLEGQHSEHHLGGGAGAPSPSALLPTSTHYRHDRLDDLLIVERPIDFPEPRLHQPFRLWQHQAEEHHLRQLHLYVSSPNHASL
jgi:hypothetical protein